MSGYGFQNVGDYELSAEKILQRKPDSVLWRLYLGRDYELGKSIRAPYRADRNPSFCLKYDTRSGKIIAKDYGSGGFHGDVFDYVQMLYNLDYYSALVKVNQDFDLGLGYNPDRSKGVSGSKVSMRDAEMLKEFQQNYEQKEVLIQYKPRHFTKADAEYWTQYGITGRTILKYKVYAAEKVWRDKALVYYHKGADPCYVYFFPEADYRPRAHAKCYWPKRKTYRFMGNCSNIRDVQGYDQCSIAKKQYADLLVLTKSMKDCMVLHEFGVEAMATHGESQKFDADFIRHLRKYYKRIISLYDRDVTGMIGGASGKGGARYLWREYGIRPYFINKKYMCKDVSDLYKAHGKDITNIFIQQLKEDDQKNYGGIPTEK